MNQILLAILVSIAPIACLAQQNSQQRALADTQQQWMDSYNQRDAKKLAGIESDDFRIVFGDGREETKSEQIAQMSKPLPKGTQYSISLEKSEFRLYGTAAVVTAAVVTGVVVEKGKVPNAKGVFEPFESRSRYTDTWIFRNGRWQVVASHLSELK